MRPRIQLRLVLTAFLFLGLTGCGLPQSMLHPGGRAADKLATLIWIEVITFCAVAFIMWVLLGWASLRRRGSLESHEPYTTGGGQSWILIGGFAIPFVILSAIFVLGIDSMKHFPVNAGMKPEKPEIQVIGHQWWWELQYVAGPLQRHFTTANEIHIPVGRPVDIELQTADVIHSFWVPTLHGKVDLIPGQPNYIRIEADHPGVFHGQCAEYCGEQHAHMLLLVVAQPEPEYEAWVNQQLQPAAEPTTQEAMHGRDVFMSAACSLCHRIRGTDALGAVAPDLTHLASRRGIASDSYDNNAGNLEAWITHAQSLKPGAAMPDLTAFNGADSRALVAFLQQLH